MAVKYDRNARKKVRRLHRRCLIITIAVFLSFSLLVSLNEVLGLSLLPSWDSIFIASGIRQDNRVATDELRMTVLDVGNADCILLQSGASSLLIDAGEAGTATDVTTSLRRLGITRLDCVIATHSDTDHIGGMKQVITTFPIDRFLMSFMPEGKTPTTRSYERMLSALDEKSVTPIQATYGSIYRFGEATIRILSGRKDYADTNNQSVICKITHRKTSFLMMGDAGIVAERDLLQSGENLHADVLKVGHHGSDDASQQAFINAVSPSYAIITCSIDNSYGHPSGETVEKLRRRNATILRSDLDGTITLISDGTTIRAVTEK